MLPWKTYKKIIVGLHPISRKDFYVSPSFVFANSRQIIAMRCKLIRLAFIPD